jgi:hypothetical protein
LTCVVCIHRLHRILGSSLPPLLLSSIRLIFVFFFSLIHPEIIRKLCFIMSFKEANWLQDIPVKRNSNSEKQALLCNATLFLLHFTATLYLSLYHFSPPHIFLSLFLNPVIICLHLPTMISRLWNHHAYVSFVYFLDFFQSRPAAHKALLFRALKCLVPDLSHLNDTLVWSWTESGSFLLVSFFT